VRLRRYPVDVDAGGDIYVAGNGTDDAWGRRSGWSLEKGDFLFGRAYVDGTLRAEYHFLACNPGRDIW
jgi:hypothetical protein